MIDFSRYVLAGFGPLASLLRGDERTIEGHTVEIITEDMSRCFTATQAHQTRVCGRSTASAT
jgi:hypothetical protein